MSLLKQAKIDRYILRSGNGLFITFKVTDSEPEDLEQLEDLLKKDGILYFRNGERLTDEEKKLIDNFKMTSFNGKTHSQRLRGTIYLNYLKTDKKLSFEEFYAKEMERFIKYQKEKN